MESNFNFSRRKRNIFYTILWLLVFSFVNYPMGAWAGQKVYPFILGIPFSIFYFWTAYTVLIIIGVIISWRVWRD